MMERIAEPSSRPTARTGVVSSLYLLTAVFTGFFIQALLGSRDAAETANNMLAHEPLFRLPLAADLVAVACYIALTALMRANVPWWKERASTTEERQ